MENEGDNSQINNEFTLKQSPTFISDIFPTLPLRSAMTISREPSGTVRKLFVLPVACYCPDVHEGGEEGEGGGLVGDAGEVAAAYEDGADGIDVIVHRVDVGSDIRPVWH